MASYQPVFRGLVDDAGLFPPTALSMADALARHRDDERAGSDLLTGRFLVPASRVDELLGALDDERLEVGLVVDVPPGGVRELAEPLRDDPRTTLTAVELRLPAADSPADAVAAVKDAVDGLPARIAVFVEVPLDDHLPETLAALGDAGLGAKVRCGGLEPSAFPAPDGLARFLAGVVRESVPFKATAGLHHAVRYVDERTGFQHHGVLNLLVALVRAVESRPHDELVAALTTDDAQALVDEVARTDDELGLQARELLVAYGSCSTSTLAADLHDLGLD